MCVLGDLTDAKDNHPAELVNRIVRELTLLQQKCPGLRIIILAGNHDWLKAGQEFFRFLNVMPGVTFVTDPWEESSRRDRGEASAYFLPYSKQPVTDWKGMDFSHYEYLFMHQTIKGAVSSNGQEMDGESLPELDVPGVKVYSGDIHVPQVIGPVEYVGSPYHVHLGDNFTPRAVLLGQDRKAKNLHFQTIKRMTVKVTSLRELKKLDIRPGDQVKVRLELDASERHAWSRLRREATDMLRAAGAEVLGAELVAAHDPRRLDVSATRARTPQDALLAYVEREGLGGHVLDAGMDLL